MKKFIYILIAIVSISFLACENDKIITEETISEINPDNLYAKTQFNLDMKDFAMAVSKAVNTNKSFRKLIKEEAMKQFDGDYDILLSNIVEKPVAHNDVDEEINTPNKVKANFTVRDLLEDAFYTLNEVNKLESARAKTAIKKMDSRQLAAASTSTLIDELTEEYPLLQVSVPVHAEDLEDESYVPPVTFITEEAYLGTASNLVAYQETETILLETNTAPETAVIVVGMNERVDINDDITLAKNVPSKPVLSGSVTESGIRLTWTTDDEFDVVNYFEIYRKSSGSSTLKKIAVISSLSMPYVYDDISELESMASYTYYVVACNADGKSWSEPKTFQSPPKPNPVTDFDAILQAQNEIELRWDNDNTQYISSTKLYRKTGVNYDYSPFKTFTANDSYCFDRDINGGDRVYYRITHNNNMGESNGSYDFVYVPYRNILEQSPVILDKITYSWRDSEYGAIENWFQGLPDFQIIIYGNDSKGGSVELYKHTITVNSTGSYSYGKTLYNWLPYNLKWYDVLTFKVIEQDADLGSIEVKIPVKINAKFGTDSTTVSGSVGIEATYTSPTIHIGWTDLDMGTPQYYTYYEPTEKILSFDYFDLKLYLK